MVSVDINRAFSGRGPDPGRLQFQPVAMLARHCLQRSFEREAGVKRWNSSGYKNVLFVEARGCSLTR